MSATTIAPTATTCSRCGSTHDLWTDPEMPSGTYCDDCRIDWFDWSDEHPEASFGEWTD